MQTLGGCHAIVSVLMWETASCYYLGCCAISSVPQKLAATACCGAGQVAREDALSSLEKHC